MVNVIMNLTFNNLKWLWILKMKTSVSADRGKSESDQNRVVYLIKCSWKLKPWYLRGWPSKDLFAVQKITHFLQIYSSSKQCFVLALHFIISNFYSNVLKWVTFSVSSQLIRMHLDIPVFHNKATHSLFRCFLLHIKALWHLVLFIRGAF